MKAEKVKEAFETTAISYKEARKLYKEAQLNKYKQEKSLAIVKPTDIGWGLMVPEFFLQLARRGDITNEIGVYLYIVTKYNMRINGHNTPVPVPRSLITKELGINNSSVTGLMRRLINKGYITRTKKARGTIPSEYAPTNNERPP